MRFIKFVIGGLLIVGATLYLIFMFTLGIGFAALGGSHGMWNWLISVVIILIAYFGGVWLVRRNRP